MMVNSIYGDFDLNQIEKYKTKLHKKIFWLLLYKDPKTKDNYPEVDFDKYFIYLMKEIDGFNQLLKYPSEIVEIMSILQAAYNETLKDNFDYQVYRKFILDAHSLIDKIDKEV
jgi:hypothetical protein